MIQDAAAPSLKGALFDGTPLGFGLLGRSVGGNLLLMRRVVLGGRLRVRLLSAPLYSIPSDEMGRVVGMLMRLLGLRVV